MGRKRNRKHREIIHSRDVTGAAGRIRIVNKGYSDAGASHYKKSTKGFNAVSGAAQEDIDFNNYTLRQRSRMLYMAAPIATSAIKTNRTNVVGIGLRLKSRIDREFLGMTVEQADRWQKMTEREFALWADKKQNCDATGTNNFSGMQQLALTSWLMSGDCIGVFKYRETDVMHPYALRIQLIEADRVSTPMDMAGGGGLRFTTGKTQNGNWVYDGVEVDAGGMIQAYHICNRYPFELGNGEKTQWKRVSAYGKETGLPNVLHVMDSERPGQYRGVSYLAQIIEPLLQLRRYTESELTAAIVESFFTAFVKTENPDENPFNEVGGDVDEVSKSPDEYEMGPAQINFMKQNEDIVFADPKRPNNGFDVFTRAICTQIGAALEIPGDLLLKQFGASYSASRAELLEAWKAFRMRRIWFADDFCQPAYEVWLSEAIARGRITAPGFFTDPMVRMAYCGSEWIGPSQGMLDPSKEIKAEILAVNKGFTTHEDATIRLNGGTWESNMDKLERENKRLLRMRGSRRGNAVDKDTGVRTDD